MAEYSMTARMAGAVSLVVEQNPQDWGAKEHLQALRYLVLACSNQAKAKLGKVGDKPAIVQENGQPMPESITVNWATLGTELRQSGKLAECANFKKFLAAGDYPQFKAAKAVEAKYAE